MQEWIVTGRDAGLRLDAWLARHVPRGSRRRAVEWIARGKVYLAGNPVVPAQTAQRLAAGDRIGLWMDRPGSAVAAARTVEGTRPPLHVLHSDRSIVVVNKPAGVLVTDLPDGTRDAVTLCDLVRDRLAIADGRGLHVVHRIDRDTSGLVLFARTPAACEALAAQFKACAPERVYLAVLLGRLVPPAGTWRDRLAWDAKALQQRRAHGRDSRSKEAVATYAVREHFAGATLVEVSLVTGKRNQIRVQAALRGHPVLGEVKYRFGAPREPPGMPHLTRYALHAARLGIVHPATSERMVFEAPLPEDLARLIAELRGRAVGPERQAKA